MSGRTRGHKENYLGKRVASNISEGISIPSTSASSEFPPPPYVGEDIEGWFEASGGIKKGCTIGYSPKEPGPMCVVERSSSSGIYKYPEYQLSSSDANMTFLSEERDATRGRMAEMAAERDAERAARDVERVAMMQRIAKMYHH